MRTYPRNKAWNETLKGAGAAWKTKKAEKSRTGRRGGRRAAQGSFQAESVSRHGGLARHHSSRLGMQGVPTPNPGSLAPAARVPAGGRPRADVPGAAQEMAAETRRGRSATTGHQGAAPRLDPAAG